MKCLLCSSDTTEIYHNKVWSVEEGNVYKCRNCDLMFLDCGFKEGEAEDFYKDYGKHLLKRGFLEKNDPVDLYDKTFPVAQERLKYIKKYFEGKDTIIEIGSGAGGFVGALEKEGVSTESVIAIESCEEHCAYIRDRFGVNSFNKLELLPDGFKADIICLFHVFEHIPSPVSFLKLLKNYLRPRGQIIIEVPSSTDPLLALYDNEEFKNFYFQPMHEYIYSPKSLKYVLEEVNIKKIETVFYQRYGLDNHLKWLTGKQTVIEQARNVFGKNFLQDYRKRMEESGTADTVFFIAEVEQCIT